MITVDGLTVEFGGTTLFKDISFQINEKDRIALMGKNGAGKSTLLKIIAGVRTATRGSVSAPKDCVIAYLPQHLMTEDGRTVFEETCQAFAHLHQIQAEIDRINNELLTRTDYDSDEYMQLIENVSTLSEKFYAIDMTHFEEDVEKTLLGLGFEREDFNRPTSEFSGGWRMRIELAKLLLKSPDVLLLDEPTNHLDISAVNWLESFLRDFKGAMIIISLWLITIKHKVLSNVIGFITMENGIFLLSLSVAKEMPIIVNLGVLLDIFIAVFILGMLVKEINNEFDDLEVSQLSDLKDYEYND